MIYYATSIMKLDRYEAIRYRVDVLDVVHDALAWGDGSKKAILRAINKEAYWYCRGAILEKTNERNKEQVRTIADAYVIRNSRKKKSEISAEEIQRRRDRIKMIRSRIYVCKKTGISFGSLKEVAYHLNMKYGTIRHIFCGQRKNSTTFEVKYV